MKAKQIALFLVLDAFLVLTAYAVWAHGYIGFFELLMANAATVTVGVDLVIALSLFLVWMAGDAKRRGMNPIPYTLLTLTLGSVGPLVYLIRRGSLEVDA